MSVLKIEPEIHSNGVKYTLSKANMMLTGKFREYSEQYQLCADVFGYSIDNK